MTTHGTDGALLGTERVDLSKGQIQCSFTRVPEQGHQMHCSLVAGHSGGHRDGYLSHQAPQTDWSLALWGKDILGRDCVEIWGPAIVFSARPPAVFVPMQLTVRMPGLAQLESFFVDDLENLAVPSCPAQLFNEEALFHPSLVIAQCLKGRQMTLRFSQPVQQVRITGRLAQ